MLPELRDFLAESATPEQLDLIEGAIGAIDGIGLENYKDTYTELLMTNETRDAGETILAIHDYTEQVLGQILQEHGIVISDETTILMMTKIVEGIMSLQDYECPQDLLDLIADDATTEENLAVLLQQVTEYYAETYMSVLEFVNPYLIKRLKDNVQRDSDNQPAEDVNPLEAEQIERLKKYVRFLSGSDNTIIDHVRSGLSLGYPLSTYVRSLGLNIEQMPPKRCAQELIAMALISSDAYQKPDESITTIIDHFISSIDQITQITIAMRDILVRFERYE